MSSEDAALEAQQTLNTQPWTWAIVTFLAVVLGGTLLLLALPREFMAMLALIALLAGLLAVAVWQLRRRQLLLEASRRSIFAAFDQLPHLVTVIDDEGRISFANQGLAAFAGKDASDLSGERRETLPGGEALWNPERRSEAPSDAVCSDAAGSARRLQITSAPFLDAEAERGATLVIGVDVTAYHDAETSRRRIALAMDQAGEAIAVHDLSGRIEIANSAYAKTMGFEGEDISGRHITAMTVDGSDDLELLREVTATLDRGDTWKKRYASRWPDGYRYRDATVAPFRDEAGSIIGYIGVLRDVTREVDLEQALRQSQKLEAVGRLSGGIAHDFNNLLTVILGFADTLRVELAPDATAARAAAEIERAALRGSELTRKLLDFSRQRTHREASAALRDVIEELQPMLRQLLGESFPITLDLDEALGHVKTDSSDIEQILVNLCVNARDATLDDGALHIRTRIEAVEAERVLTQPPLKPGRYGVLEVSDNGPGMTPEVRERALEPFFTTKEMSSGTGLGLSTVYGIVDQLGGAMRLDSAPGQGTMVTVWLPLAPTPAAAEAGEAAVDAREGSAGKQILVVEDEGAIRGLITTALERAGCCVSSAEDGLAALEQVPGLPAIDLLITDIVMPRMGGLELRDALRETHPDTPVLFISGYAPDDPRARSLRENDILLRKPFRTTQLLEEVEALLAR